LNSEHFANVDAAKSVMQRDLEACLQHPLQIEIFTADNTASIVIGKLTGTCIDDLDIAIDNYSLNPSILRTESGIADELLYSDLLKSNCPITNQPDWGSIQIHYQGPKIDHASLLAYIISYRHHQEFRECCVERIFMDIKRQCQPQQLTVYVCEARRGGLDINPYRSTNPQVKIEHQRLWRQ
jgi:7-cyano-7-deazaguanine reductase